LANDSNLEVRLNQLLSSSAEGSTNPLKVLIVDDNPGMRAVCSALLSSADYQVATTEDGFSALLHLAKNVPDLIICDLVLPRMSGFEFLSLVRRRFPEVRVMAMSGAFLGDSVPGGVLADAFYSKGQSPKTFLSNVATLLRSPAPKRREEKMAAVWIPLKERDSEGNQYVVVTCPDCFRTFPLTVKVASSPEVLVVSCFFCFYQVRYVNDFTRVAAAADSVANGELMLQDLSPAAVAEAAAGAANDEIASQVPLI